MIKWTWGQITSKIDTWNSTSRKWSEIFFSVYLTSMSIKYKYKNNLTIKDKYENNISCINKYINTLEVRQ